MKADKEHQITQAEWERLSAGLCAKASSLLHYWLACGADAIKTPLGVQLFREDWEKMGQYRLLTLTGEEMLRSIDPFN